MESPDQPSLPALLASSLAHSNLPPIIDAEQVAVLLHCSKGQVEDLAESGRLPATKFGRGWVFVTAQVVYSVLKESTSNAPKRTRAPNADEVARRVLDAGTTGARSSKPLELPPTPRPRGRPRKFIPDHATPK
jgi:excisionase family DNA binding protein